MPAISQRSDGGLFAEAFRSASVWAGMVVIAAAVVMGAVVGVARAEPHAPISIALLVVLWAALLLSHLVRRLTATLLAFAVGAAAVTALALLTLTSQRGLSDTKNLSLALPAIALVLIPGVGGALAAFLWPTLGFALGNGAGLVAAAATGTAPAVNIAVLGAFLLVIGVRAAEQLARRAERRRSDAAPDDPVPSARGAATEALAAVAIGHLSAIAESGSGPLDRRVREGVQRDLRRLIGPDWRALVPVEAHPPALPDPDRRLAQLEASAASVGVAVHLVGEIRALDRLDRVRFDALDAALAQCAVNVARHAQVHEAELRLETRPGLVVASLCDDGVGFDAGDVASDRVGLRVSVRARIEAVGGEVEVHSQSGAGTRVVITLPARAG